MATVTSVGLVLVGNRGSWIGSMRLDFPRTFPRTFPRQEFSSLFSRDAPMPMSAEGRDRTREVGIGPPGLRDRARDASRGVASDAGSWDRPSRVTRPSAGRLPRLG